MIIPRICSEEFRFSIFHISFCWLMTILLEWLMTILWCVRLWFAFNTAKA